MADLANDVPTVARDDFTEDHYFLLEAASQLGFKTIDDDGYLFVVKDEWIVEFAKRVRASAIDACCKAAARRLSFPDPCESLGIMDPETGQRECARETRGDECSCAMLVEEVERIAARIGELKVQGIGKNKTAVETPATS